MTAKDRLREALKGYDFAADRYRSAMDEDPSSTPEFLIHNYHAATRELRLAARKVCYE